MIAVPDELRGLREFRKRAIQAFASGRLHCDCTVMHDEECPLGSIEIEAIEAEERWRAIGNEPQEEEEERGGETLMTPPVEVGPMASGETPPEDYDVTRYGEGFGDTAAAIAGQMQNTGSYMGAPPPEGYAANVAANVAWLEKPTPPAHPGGRSFDR